VRFSELEGAAVGVWGAGREIGSFAAQLARRLPAARIAVAAFDAEPPAPSREKLLAPHAQIVTGAEIVPALSGCDVVVRSPGVSIHRPELHQLRERGMLVTTPTSLWLTEHGPEGVVGVTGTKGKSTTAALVHHLARAAGVSVRLAGNIGAPAIDLLDGERTRLIVLELSSYQLADLQSGPEVALVTSLFREHIDWHGSEAGYRAEKLRLLALPGVRVALVNGRDPRLTAALRDLDLDLGSDAAVVEYGVPGGWDLDANGEVTLAGRPVLAGGELPLRGEHNALNLCGALAALEALGVRPQLPHALEGFAPLAHRLEEVLERDGVLWVNDSISTTPESTLAALSSYPDRGAVLIAGGQDRGQDYSELGGALARTAATVIGVPSTGARVLEAARAAGADPVRTLQARDLEQAVELARARARAGDVVLLSPAAPSYDHYRDFEERGERFRTLATLSPG